MAADGVLQEILLKSGVELFRELRRIYDVADVEDYYKSGAWQDKAMRADYALVEMHRREAGAPEPPALEDVVMPKLPAAPMSAGSTFRLPGMVPGMVKPPGMLKPGAIALSPGVAAAAALKPLAMFIAKKRLVPATAKKLILDLEKPAQLYVMTNFNPKGTGVEATKELEEFLAESRKTDAWKGFSLASAAKPLMTQVRPQGAAVTSVGAAKTPLTTKAAQDMKSLAAIALFISQNKLDPAKAKPLIMALEHKGQLYVICNFKTDAKGPAAQAKLEEFVAKCKASGAVKVASAGGTKRPAESEARSEDDAKKPKLAGKGGAQGGAAAAKDAAKDATKAAGKQPTKVTPPGGGSLIKSLLAQKPLAAQ